MVEEQDGQGATLATYAYGNYIDEVLQMRRGGPGRLCDRSLCAHVAEGGRDVAK